MSLYPMRNTPQLIQGLNDLIEYAREQLGDLSTKKIIEIGSYAGESSVMFAKHFKEVVCIDPFNDGYDANDIASSYAPFSEVEKAFDENVKEFKNIIKIKATSDHASTLLTERYDMVYIDGMHTYEQVSKDINNYLQWNLHPLCIVSGHDYSDNWIGVKNAVNDFFKSPHKTFQDTSWAITLK